MQCAVEYNGALRCHCQQSTHNTHRNFFTTVTICTTHHASRAKRMKAHTHAQTEQCIQTRVHAYMYAYAYTYMCRHAHTHIYTYAHTYIHRYMHAREDGKRKMSFLPFFRVHLPSFRLSVLPSFRLSFRVTFLLFFLFFLFLSFLFLPSFSFPPSFLPHLFLCNRPRNPRNTIHDLKEGRKERRKEERKEEDGRKEGRKDGRKEGRKRRKEGRK